MTLYEEFPTFEQYHAAHKGTLRYGQAFMNYFAISGRPEIYFQPSDEKAKEMIEADPALSKLLLPPAPPGTDPAP